MSDYSGEWSFFLIRFCLDETDQIYNINNRPLEVLQGGFWQQPHIYCTEMRASLPVGKKRRIPSKL